MGFFLDSYNSLFDSLFFIMFNASIVKTMSIYHWMMYH